MIFCETAGNDSAAFDALVTFASQARGNDIPAVISDRSVLASASQAHQFDAAPFLTDARPGSSDTIVLLSAHLLGPDRINHLRDLAKGKTIGCIAYGKFETRQSEITVASRLAYALNKEPSLIAQTDDTGLPAIDVPLFGAKFPVPPRKIPKVGLFFPDLADAQARADLRSLQLGRHFDVEILTTGDAKKNWVASDGYQVPAWHLGELMPRSLAARFDIAVFYGKPSGWARFQMLVANLAVNGATLIDGTLDRTWQSVVPEFVAGPARIGDLKDWLVTSVLAHRTAVADALLQGSFVKSISLPPALHDLKVAPPRRSRHSVATDPRVLFVPTNGVGLGHAKRCSLVADAMRNEAKATFAAFPSCIGMLTANGFDAMPLVSRTGHRAPHDNDLVNASRLAAAASQSSVTVFDGGYVFDSVMRAGADHGRKTIWIRRGLWQAGQNNQVALDRQKTFTKIIVPSEAFDELNAPTEGQRNVVTVGPIVQQTDLSDSAAKTLRQKLAKQLKLTGKQLVVTMLGGGVAADRRAQINMICAHLAGRDDVMHLLVVWPTATTDAGWFQYPNTRVVQSVHASALIPLADLFVSAIGYNSFHEAIYGQVPTIFVPQMAGYMDDQRARGVAAAERNLALLVEPWELLSLSRAIDDCLAGQGQALRENLRGQNLPEPGTRQAAAQILEVARQ